MELLSFTWDVEQWESSEPRRVSKHGSEQMVPDTNWHVLKKEGGKGRIKAGASSKRLEREEMKEVGILRPR